MRGRERMLSEGPGFLSEEELVALLLGSGARPANEVAARLLRGGLANLRRARYASLTALPGVGSAQACRVLAAMELGRRAGAALPGERRRLWNAGVVARRLFQRLAFLAHEEFWVLLLNARLEEIRAVRISMGGLTHCSVLPREALAPALIHAAPVVLFAHNHPSGDPEPSAEDRRLQLSIDSSARMLGLRVADHVVLAESGMHSLREGLLQPPPAPDAWDEARDCEESEEAIDGRGALALDAGDALDERADGTGVEAPDALAGEER